MFMSALLCGSFWNLVSSDLESSETAIVKRDQKCDSGLCSRCHHEPCQVIKIRLFVQSGHFGRDAYVGRSVGNRRIFFATGDDFSLWSLTMEEDISILLLVKSTIPGNE